MTGAAAGPARAISVYADVWCPFAYVGLITVLNRRQELGRGDLIVDVHPWPLELVNGRPQDAMVTKRHVDELRSQLVPSLFAGFDPLHFPATSMPALALEALAHRAGCGEQVSMALRRALFEEGRDIADPAVLNSVAVAHDLTVPGPSGVGDVIDQWHQGQRRGVKGSPHFFCGDVDVFCPSLDIARTEDGHLLLNRNREELDQFLRACLAQ